MLKIAHGRRKPSPPGEARGNFCAMTNRHAFACLVAALLPTAAAAQNGAAVRDEMMRHFDESMSKVIALAGAMPADKYTWKPSEPSMPVGHVYAHIARYNFWYLTQEMKLPGATGIGIDTLEAMRDKAQIVALLRRSADHVRKGVAAMPNAQLDAPTTLYGRSVPQWAVLVQLVAHMNEHLGQSIAYARSNNVTPPWSQ
jgi:uncharacterized damage-inducible protein DinB